MIPQAKELLAAFIARRFAEVVARALIAPEPCRLAAPEQLHDKGRGEDGLQQGAHGWEVGRQALTMATLTSTQLQTPMP